MDNQHKFIKGYRDLTPAEIVLMNSIKRQEGFVKHLLEEVGHNYLSILQNEVDANSMTMEVFNDKIDVFSHLSDKAKEHLMIGFMLAVRAVAQPQPINDGKEAHVPWERVSGHLKFRSDIKSTETVVALCLDGTVEQTTLGAVTDRYEHDLTSVHESHYQWFVPKSKFPVPKS